MLIKRFYFCNKKNYIAFIYRYFFLKCQFKNLFNYKLYIKLDKKILL